MPAVQQSGKGGTFVLPTTNLTGNGAEFNTAPAGAPYFGQDPQNSDMCESCYSVWQRAQSDELIILPKSLLQRNACGNREAAYLPDSNIELIGVVCCLGCVRHRHSRSQEIR